MAVFKYNYFKDVHEGFNPLTKKISLERIDRPKIPVVFAYNKIMTSPIWCLLDSGADKIVLGNDFAEFLNIDLSKGAELKTQVVGGAIIKARRHPIGLIFEKRRFSVMADFLETPYPLLGRSFFDFFASINFKESGKIVELVLQTNSN